MVLRPSGLTCLSTGHPLARPPVCTVSGTLHPCQPFNVRHVLTPVLTRSASAGLGGFVRFPAGQTCYFQARLSRAQLSELVDWFAPSAIPQRFIACWELLAQIALVWLVHSMLPPNHLHVNLSCGNAVAEFASWKGLSTAKGFCHLLRCFLYYQEDCPVSALVILNHIPGILNGLSDKLSRSGDPSALGFQPDQSRSPPWAALASLPVIQTYPPGLGLRSLFGALS